MCSTPKRTGILFHATRLGEETAGSDYTAMLRRASRCMDKVQDKREMQSPREQAKKPGTRNSGYSSLPRCAVKNRERTRSPRKPFAFPGQARSYGRVKIQRNSVTLRQF